MLATKRHMKRRAVKAQRKAQWGDYKEYKAECRKANFQPMSFDDWKSPEKEKAQ